MLVDGSFRRGTDILKALAFGARAVLVGRPVMWGLAAYGADGVQGVIEMLQTELARYMAMCGRSTISKLDRTVLQSARRADERDRRPTMSSWVRWRRRWRHSRVAAQGARGARRPRRWLAAASGPARPRSWIRGR